MSSRVGKPMAVPSVGRAPGMQTASVVASLLLVLLSIVVLAGWCWDIAALKSVLPQWVSMKANTAVGFLFSGIALGLTATRRPEGGARSLVAKLCASFVALLGACTIAEYMLRWNLGMDNVLFPEPVGATLTSSPGRMAPGTAAGFLFSGLALLVVDCLPRTRVRPSEFLALPPLALALLALLGYLYDAVPLYWMGHSTAMAMHTALAFAVLGVGILLASPGGGWLRLLASDTPGGSAARAMTPTVLLVLPLLFWLRQVGERAGFYGTEFGVALMVLVCMLLLSLVVCWNASRLDRAEASLRRSAARFESIFQQAAVGIALVAPDGRWLLVNRKLCEIVGYSEEELLARTFQDITHPDDLGNDLEQVRRMLAHEIGTYAMEKRYRRRDGSTVWISLTVSMAWTPEGEPDYFISVVEDIDARKQAEEALRQSESKLGEANRLAGLGHWEWDLRTDTHTWSDDVYRFYGRDPTLPPARYPEVRQYFTPESWERLAAAVESGTAQGIPYECDAELAGGDGPSRWITARGRAVRDRDGNVVLMHGTVQDVTERKRTEERLQSLNRQLDGLQEALRRLATSRTLDEIMGVARTTARRLVGADGATFVLRDGDQCFYADEEAIAPLWKGKRFPMSICISGWSMLNRVPVVIEDIYADPRIPVDAYRPTFVKSLAIVPIRAAEPVGAIGAYWAAPHSATDEEVRLLCSLADGVSVAIENVRSYDLLERRVQERTGELRAANAELDAFAYAVSHDLRAPLRAMSGFSQALIEDFGSVLPSEAREFLDEIVTGSQRMGELINGLLRLSRGTRGEVKRDRVDISGIALGILARLATSEPDRRVEWEVEPGLVVRGDARMLEIVLENLLDNAWKYTGGTALARIRVYAEHRPAEDVFCVADNGAGFDVRHADKLFEPFQRLHRQDEFPGIGIGLATVKRILNRHGGSVAGESVPGEATTFHCRLPHGDSTEGESIR